MSRKTTKKTAKRTDKELEKAVRVKLGQEMLWKLEDLDDVIYDDLDDEEAAFLERNGFACMCIFDMQKIVNAGMKDLYGIDLLKELKK